MGIFSFLKRAQPKEEHPMQEIWNMAEEDSEIIKSPDGTQCQLTFPMGGTGYVEQKLTLSPSDDLFPHVPRAFTDPTTYTAQEVAALREYVRRCIDGGHQYSEWYCKSVAELAGEVGLSLDRSGYSPVVQPDLDSVFPLKYRSPVMLALNEPRGPKSNHSIISKLEK